MGIFLTVLGLVMAAIGIFWSRLPVIGDYLDRFAPLGTPQEKLITLVLCVTGGFIFSQGFFTLFGI